MLAMYSPMIPIKRIVMPLKKEMTDINDAQPTMVEPLRYAIKVHIIKTILKQEMRTPERVMRWSGTAEKLEIPFNANKIIFFKGYLVVPAVRFMRS